jgi:hydrogenase expression/formation protein HypC
MCLAVPGRVVEIFADDASELKRGKIDFGGIRKEVCLAFTPEVRLGDYVLVHVGFALTIVDEAEANRIFDQWAVIEELAETNEVR